MTLTADIVRPDALSAAELETWRVFQASDPAFLSPLLAPEFSQAVGRVRADSAVAVFRRRGRAVGFLPHHRRPGGLARPIGAVWSDTHALIADPAERFTGSEALKAAGLSSFRVNGLIDPVGRFGAGATEPRDFHIVAFEGSAEAYWESRRAASAKRFKNLRRLEHKLEREVGAVGFVAPDRSRETLEQIFSWKRQQYRRTAHHDVLASDWSRRLMRDLFETTEGRFQGLLLTLTVAGRPVAGHFGVRLGQVFHPWVAAFDPSLAAYSPGWSFLAHMIAAMPGLGLTRCELGGGHDHYKVPVSSEVAIVGTGLLHADKPRLSVDAALGLAGRALGEARAPIVDRVRRRLDHIASAEPRFDQRVKGLATALRAANRVVGETSEAET